jgi:hypothetical protein
VSVDANLETQKVCFFNDIRYLEVCFVIRAALMGLILLHDFVTGDRERFGRWTSSGRNARCLEKVG